MLTLLTLLVAFPRRSDIPEYDVADLPALREIDINALLPRAEEAAPNDKLDQMAAKASAEAPVSPSAVGADVD